MMQRELFQKLTAWRNETARRSRVERFHILQNKTIEILAETMPKTYEELADVKGIGKKKLHEFGSEILALVKECAVIPPSSSKTHLQGGDPHNPPSINRLPLEDSLRTRTGVSGGSDLKAAQRQLLSNFGEEGEKNEKVFTVSGFLNFLNTVLGERDVFIRGEVSSVQVHPSGIYFTLKDKIDESILNCYIRPSTYERMGVQIEEGLEVKVSGVPNVYKPKGRLSFLVYSLELAGEGSLKKAYEMLKKKLESEGLFERKRALPEFITRIGIITSRTGAVIDDFRRNLESLGLQLYFYDARVEGARAVDDILRGIRWFNTHMDDLDILVIIRGGGSLEDLQAFNNEFVARAIFSSKIITLCGIGHDRDVPITNLVADRATSTPSIVAMTINESWKRLHEGVPTLAQDLLYSFEAVLSERKNYIRGSVDQMLGYMSQLFLRYKYLGRELEQALLGIGLRLEEIRKRSREMIGLARAALEQIFKEVSRKLISYETYLEGVSPERNLKLGYSIIRNVKGGVVKSVEDLAVGEKVMTKLYKGEFVSKIEEIK
ncbi:MAG: exodeoxyribonuclease VII large subunit [Parcubacteria group bacterium]|nr:exodeoxyribonuclease VII large subunit [Parcubacteria group bacterium]